MTCTRRTVSRTFAYHIHSNLWKLSNFGFGTHIRRTGRSLPHKLLERSMGQHILRNDKLLQKIVDSVALSESDTALEIGAGSGNLTLRILEQCGKLYAVDIDPKMTHILHKRVNRYYPALASKLHCVLGNILGMRIPDDVRVIFSNVPYQISSELIFKLLSHNNFDAAVLLFQEEFIQKLVSKPNSKQYSRLSVNAQMHCRIERLFSVDRKHFQPPPNVDSGVVRLVPYQKDSNPWMLSDTQHKYEFASLLLDNHGKYTMDDGSDADEDDEMDGDGTTVGNRKLFEYGQWNEFLKICFSQKNKKLAAVFDIALQHKQTKLVFSDDAKIYGSNTAVVTKQLLENLNLNTQRANGTNIADFLRLYDEMRCNGIQFRA